MQDLLAFGLDHGGNCCVHETGEIRAFVQIAIGQVMAGEDAGYQYKEGVGAKMARREWPAPDTALTRLDETPQKFVKTRWG